MGHKLNYKVEKDADGDIVRRVLDNDNFGLHVIDVEWTHTEGFPSDTVTVPVSHPPDIIYETREVGTREVIHDCLTLDTHVSDETIMAMLDKKRQALAKSLGIDP